MGGWMQQLESQCGGNDSNHSHRFTIVRAGLKGTPGRTITKPDDTATNRGVWLNRVATIRKKGRNSMRIPAIKIMSCAAFALPMLLGYSPTAQAEYSFQLVDPPGAEFSQTFGINNSGTVTGGANDGVDSFGFVYDIRTGTYTVLASDFTPLDINNSGAMIGSLGDDCAIRDKRGNVTLFSAPTAGARCFGRGINSNGTVSGYEVDEDGIWSGFVHDPRKGTFTEFLPSPQTIAHAINGRGDVAGSVFLFAGEAFPGSAQGRYGFVRDKNGSVKQFAVSQARPGTTRARGVSDAGTIAGFYTESGTFESKSYVATLSSGTDFETITLADDQIVYRKPCNPNLPPAPGPGYDLYTDVLASQIRNDGVVVGNCFDQYVNETTGDFVVYQYGFVATPGN